MAKKKKAPIQVTPYERKDRFQQKVGETVDRLGADLPKRTNQFIAIAVVLIAIGGAIFYQQKSNAATARSEMEGLGAALIHLYTGNQEQQQIELERFLATNPSHALTRAKAELLLGNILYQNRQFDRAEELFRSSAKNSGNTLLIASAARHGIGSTLMQKGEWQAAAEEWEDFLSDYAKRSGTARDQAAGKDKVDETPLVSDVLYKLAVVQLQLGEKEKAKATCQRILKSYYETRVAAQAEKLLSEI